MVLSRSIETWPSVSERMSRIVASVTKPSVTSTFPSGVLKRFCSVSAMFSWSWLMMPLVSSVWPSGICESGVTWTVAMGALARLEDGQAALGLAGVELARSGARLRERPAVELGRGLAAAEMVEAHGEVEGDVGARGIEAEGLEELGLRLAPARLLRGARGMAREVAAQLAFHRLGTRGLGERGDARDRRGILRVEVQRAAIALRGHGGFPAARLGGREPEQRVDAGGVGGEGGGIARTGGREVAARERPVARLDVGRDARPGRVAARELDGVLLRHGGLPREELFGGRAYGARGRRRFGRARGRGAGGGAARVRGCHRRQEGRLGARGAEVGGGRGDRL